MEGRKFDDAKTFFGFKDLEHLSDIDLDAEKSKGWPCVATERGRAKRQMAIKVLPMSKTYPEETHPVKIESALLQEFSKLTRALITPHIPAFFASFDVRNNCRALTAFPLKLFRGQLLPKTHILAAEFVTGGSVEEWTSEVKRSVDEWRYVIFSIAWTLLVLQDKYRCVHSDLHYGNVLIHPVVPSQVTYHLITDAEDVNFCFKTPSFLPKIWDWELSSCFDERHLRRNPLCMSKDYFPSDMDPHYDLHCFLTSLLEERVQAPPEILAFVVSLYPMQLIPSDEVRALFSGSAISGSCGSQCCGGREDHDHDNGSDTDTDDANSDEAVDDELYYRTDEEGSVAGSDRSNRSSSSSARRSTRRLSNDDGCDIRTEYRTEYLFKDRLLRGATAKFPGLPTPMSMLQHPFFDTYRSPKQKGMLFRHVREL